MNTFTPTRGELRRNFQDWRELSAILFCTLVLIIAVIWNTRADLNTYHGEALQWQHASRSVCGKLAGAGSKDAQVKAAITECQNLVFNPI